MIKKPLRGTRANITANKVLVMRTYHLKLKSLEQFLFYRLLSLETYKVIAVPTPPLCNLLIKAAEEESRKTKHKGLHDDDEHRY